jgi:hypothetical protein
MKFILTGIPQMGPIRAQFWLPSAPLAGALLCRYQRVGWPCRGRVAETDVRKADRRGSAKNCAHLILQKARIARYHCSVVAKLAANRWNTTS